MNEEEKKAVEELKSCITFWQCQLISTDEKEEIEMAEREIAVNINLLNLIEKQQKEIEKKDRQIDLMAEFISDQDIDEDICKKMIKEKQCNHFTYEPDCTECIKQYFKNKVVEDK